MVRKLKCSEKRLVETGHQSTKGWLQEWEAGTPEGFNESLHFLGLTLNANMGLELPERIIQIHRGEVHLIHHTAGK